MRLIRPLIAAAGLAGLVPVLLGAMESPAEGIEVTGRLRRVNGVSRIPVGLFGVHATPLTPEWCTEWGVESVRVIRQAPDGQAVRPGVTPDVPTGIRHVVECVFDRYQPAHVLTRRDWKPYLAGLGRAHGESTRALAGDGVERAVEFWNEPYLNWATKPGVNYDGAHFDQTDTTEGAPVRIRGWTEPLEWSVWSSRLVATDERGRVDYLASSYLPKDALEGGTFDFRGKLRSIRRLPWARDTSQTSFFSARQNALWYRWMYAVFASAARAANPELPLLAGWGFPIQSDNWKAWEILFRPLLDESIRWIDGIHEHHYGGDTRMVAGAYETVAAYAATHHGKRLRFYNTEAGGNLDPQRPDTPAAPAFDAQDPAGLAATMTYGLRDLIHLLAYCPDKAVARAAHAAHRNGERWALRLLKELRGELVETRSGDPAVWTIAALRDDRLCLVAFNDGRQARSLPVRIVAPGGRRIDSVERLEIRTGPNDLVEHRTVLPAGHPVWTGSADLPSRGAVRWLFHLSGPPGPHRYADTTQHFASGILQEVEPGRTVRLEIPLRGQIPGPERAAVLRVVQTGMDASSARCAINGRPLSMPSVASWTNDWEIPAGVLRDSNIVEFSVAPTATRGYRLCAASLLVTVETRN